MIPALIVGTITTLGLVAWAGWAAVGPWLVHAIGLLDERPRPPRVQDHPCPFVGCRQSGWITVHERADLGGATKHVCATHHIDGQRLGWWTA